MVTGTLYGVGVGPGDPDLITLKAWKLIANAPVIAYLAANGQDFDRARHCEAPHPRLGPAPRHRHAHAGGARAGREGL